MTVSETIAETVERVLACPRCRSTLHVEGNDICCTRESCDFRGEVNDGVAVMAPAPEESFFDSRFQHMRHEGQGDCVTQMCYGYQEPFILPHVAAGKIVLDLGCGSEFPFERNPDAFLIGLDASLATVRANAALDLRVYGTAAALPLPDASVDTIILSYSLHHMTGLNVREHYHIVAQVLRELGRVLGSGGKAFILEVQPWFPVWVAEKILWSLARRILGTKLDMFFWHDREFVRLARQAMPGADVQAIAAPTRWFSVFAPMFSLPWLKIPRFLYPFRIVMYQVTK